MKHIFIINPAAGSRDRTKQYTEQIHRVCQSKEADYSVFVSQAPGHCKELAQQAAQSGKECRIYACGGDGTLNEVAAGAAGYANAAVTAFAGGSGNDFIKLFSETEPFRNLERLMECEETLFDMIRCNGDLCLNICSVGLDARIGTDVSKYKRIPLLHGFRAYAVSAVVNIIKGIAEHYVVQIGKERFDAEQTLICACNGRYYGGGFNPVPDADPCDGILDVLMVKKVSRMKVAQVIGKYKNGKYDQYPDLIRHFRTNCLQILCDKPTSINLDGELRVAQQVDISVAEEKLRFFYPKGLTWSIPVPAQVK